MRHGDHGAELMLVLDGTLNVDVDGEAVAEVGPGALLGERAILEGGRGTATVTALTPARVAVLDTALFSDAELSDLADGHRREDY